MKENNPDDIVMCVKFPRRTFFTFSFMSILITHSYKTSFYYNAKSTMAINYNAHLPKYNFLAIFKTFQYFYLYFVYCV